MANFFDNQSVNEICSEVEDNYDFFRRTTIKVSERKLTKEELSERLKENRQVLCIVNKKKNAKEIFEILRDEENTFYLTTNLCSVHRSKILQEIKSCLEENKFCRVISTSLVEAGVDLDFPCVYRESAGLDNIIQSAGRCNREGKFSKEESFVFVFTLSNEKIIPAQRLRVNATNLVCEKYVSDLSSPQAIEYNILERRLINGQYYHTPYFGTREFPAHFKLCEDISKIKTAYPDEVRDLGFMLYDMDYSDKNNICPMFFRAKMENGIINVKRSEVFR